MAMNTSNDPNFKIRKGYYNPLVWVAGIVATILIVMLLASIFRNDRSDRFSSRTSESNIESTQDSHSVGTPQGTVDPTDGEPTQTEDAH